MALHENPIVYFSEWLSEAERTQLKNPNAMTLSTCDTKGQPSARLVLLKHFDETGFVFFSNFESRKGQEIAANPKAALTFFWDPLEKQVRIEGLVQKTNLTESAAYFASRPRSSQIGAWASAQSRELASREELEEKFAVMELKYDGRTVPLPPFWGGYRLCPLAMEFWTGRPDRLHDRILYTRLSVTSPWKIKRLSP